MPRRKSLVLRLGSYGVALALSCCMLLLPDTARAQTAAQRPDGFVEHIDDLKLEVGGLAALLTYSGVRDWKWGTAHFRYVPEGWFGMDTGSGGQDKLGHAYTSYLQTKFLYLRLRTYHGEKASVTLWPPFFTWMIMLYVEFFDAFSVDHGFSPEDLIMDTAGVGWAYVHEKYPLTRVIDYRIEYWPSSKENGFHPMIDYSGQKFLLAFRPGEIPLLKPTALRATEFYLGYFAHGFKEKERAYNSQIFVGMGIDIAGVLEMALGPSRANPGGFYDYVGTAFSVFQMPYPYAQQVLHERQAIVY